MAGIYIHIPFCRQACHYCNFHFVTSTRRKNELIAAILKEMEIAGNPEDPYLGKDEVVDTVYFGGGTPSLLEDAEYNAIIEKIRSTFNVAPGAEITLEANPDDLTLQKLAEWKKAGINRLSIGIQSFYQDDLEWMNRAHNATQALNGLQLATTYFENITIDLIYGTPLLSDEKWKRNIETAIEYKVPHLSCYALTVEPKTPLQKLILTKQLQDIDPDKQAHQFLLLMKWMREAGYEHYEISNFAKPGFRSRHNSSYWSGKKYLGLGPSAHSYNGTERQWNISNNTIYTDSIARDIIPAEKEILTDSQKMNEQIMTSIRTAEGINLERFKNTWGKDATNRMLRNAGKYLESNKMLLENNALKLTDEGKLLADGITATLFVD